MTTIIIPRKQWVASWARRITQRLDADLSAPLVEVHVDGRGRDTFVAVGSIEDGWVCVLSRSEMRVLRDALNEALPRESEEPQT